MTMTHKQAVKRVALYFQNSRRCTVVMAERVCTSVSEQPDVIGWLPRGESILAECKVSRADFHADREKHFRRNEENGVGQLRYFAAPRGLLAADEIPDGWGFWK